MSSVGVVLPILPSVASSNTPPSVLHDNVPVTSTLQVGFNPLETPEDVKIHKACCYLDDNHTLHQEYLDKPLPSGRYLDEMKVNVNAILDRKLAITGGIHTLREFLIDQYEASVAFGNPISHFKVIGSTALHASGKLFVRKLLEDTPDILNENTESILDTEPNDLDLRAEFTKPVTKVQIEILQGRAHRFLKKSPRAYFSEEEPNMRLKFGEDKIDYGYGAYKEYNFSLLRKNAFQIAIVPDSLKANSLELNLLSRHPNMHRQAFVDALLGIMHDDEAAEKNYLAILTLVWGLLKGEKCFKRSMLSSYLFAHINKFSLKIDQWAAKFAEYIQDSSKSHGKDTFDSKFLLFIQFEFLCDGEAIYKQSLQNRAETAWKRLFPKGTSEDIFFQARSKGLPSALILLMLNAGAGLMFGCLSKCPSKVAFTERFNQPFIKFTHTSGLNLLLKWDLKSLSNAQETLSPYLQQYENELIEIFKSIFDSFSLSEASFPVLEKYKGQIHFERAGYIEKALSLSVSKSPVLQLISISFLMQLRALGIKEAEEALCTKVIPALLSSPSPEVQNAALKIAKSLLLAFSPAHLQPKVLNTFSEAPTAENWTSALAETRMQPCLRYAYGMWKTKLQVPTHADIPFILNIFEEYLETSIEALHSLFFKKDSVKGMPIEEASLAAIRSKLLHLISSPPFQIQNWWRIYDLCSHQGLKVPFAVSDLKNNFVKTLVPLHQSYLRETSPKKQQELKQQAVLAIEQLLMVCEKQAWKEECVIVAELFSSAFFKSFFPNYLDYWERLFNILDQKTPGTISRRTLFTLSSLLQSWMYKTSKAGHANYAFHRVFLVLIEHISTLDPFPAEKCFLLLNAALGHPLFKSCAVDDSLSKSIVLFLSSADLSKFQIRSMLTLALERDTNLIKIDRYALFVKVADTLLSGGTLPDLSLSKKIAEQLLKFSCHQPTSLEWSAFSTHVVQIAKRTATKDIFAVANKGQEAQPPLSSVIHLENARLVCKELVNECLLEALFLMSDEKKALSHLQDLLGNLSSFSIPQKERLIFYVQHWIKNIKEPQKLIQVIRDSPLNHHEAFFLFLNLLHRMPKNEELKAHLLTLIPKITVEKPENKVLEHAIQISLKAFLEEIKDIHWTILTAIEPIIDEDSKLLWEKHLFLQINISIKAKDAELLIQLFLDPKKEVYVLAIVKDIINLLFPGPKNSHPKLMEIIVKAAPLLDSNLWDLIWAWSEHKGKKTVSELIPLWKSHAHPLSKPAIKAVGAIAPEKLFQYFESPSLLYEKICEAHVPALAANKKRAILLKLLSSKFKGWKDEEACKMLQHLENMKLDEQNFSEPFKKFVDIAFENNFYTLMEQSCQLAIQMAAHHPNKSKNYFNLFIQNSDKWPKNTTSGLIYRFFQMVEKALKVCAKNDMKNLFPWVVEVTVPFNYEKEKIRRIQLKTIGEYCSGLIDTLPKSLEPTFLHLLAEVPSLAFMGPNCSSIFAFLNKKHWDQPTQIRLRYLWYNNLYLSLNICLQNPSNTEAQTEAHLQHFYTYLAANPEPSDKTNSLLEVALKLLIAKIILTKDYTHCESLVTDFTAKVYALRSPYPGYYTLLLFEKALKISNSNSMLLNAQMTLLCILGIQISRLFPERKADDLFFEYFKKICDFLFFHPYLSLHQSKKTVVSGIQRLVINFLSALLPDCEYSKMIKFFNNFAEIEVIEEKKKLFNKVFLHLQDTNLHTLEVSLDRLFHFVYHKCSSVPISEIGNFYLSMCNALTSIPPPYTILEITESLILITEPEKNLLSDRSKKNIVKWLCTGIDKLVLCVESRPITKKHRIQWVLDQLTSIFLSLQNTLDPKEHKDPILPKFARIYYGLLSPFLRQDYATCFLIFSHLHETLFDDVNHRFGSLAEKKAIHSHAFMLIKNAFPNNNLIDILKLCQVHPSNVFRAPADLIRNLPLDIHEKTISHLIKLCPQTDKTIISHAENALATITFLSKEKNIDKVHILSHCRVVLSHFLSLNFSLNLSPEKEDPNVFKTKIEALSLIFLSYLASLNYFSIAQTYVNRLLEKKILNCPNIVRFLVPRKQYFLLKITVKKVLQIKIKSSLYCEEALQSLSSTIKVYKTYPIEKTHQRGALSKYYWNSNPLLALHIMLMETNLQFASENKDKLDEYLAQACATFILILDRFIKGKNPEKIQNEWEAIGFAYNHLLMSPAPHSKPDLLQKHINACCALEQVFRDEKINSPDVVYGIILYKNAINPNFGDVYTYKKTVNLLEKKDLLIAHYKSTLKLLWKLMDGFVTLEYTHLKVGLLLYAQEIIFSPDDKELLDKYIETLENVLQLSTERNLPISLISTLHFLFHGGSCPLYQSNEGMSLYLKLLKVIENQILEDIKTYLEMSPLLLSLFQQGLGKYFKGNHQAISYIVDRLEYCVKNYIKCLKYFPNKENSSGWLLLTELLTKNLADYLPHETAMKYRTYQTELKNKWIESLFQAGPPALYFLEQLLKISKTKDILSPEQKISLKNKMEMQGLNNNPFAKEMNTWKDTLNEGALVLFTSSRQSM